MTSKSMTWGKKRRASTKILSNNKLFTATARKPAWLESEAKKRI